MKSFLLCMSVLTVVSILTITLSSCQDDPEEEVVYSKYLSFTVPENFVFDNNERWLFLSDRNGSVVDLVKVQGGTELILNERSGSQPPYSLHEFVKISGVGSGEIHNNFSLNTYTNIHAGDFWYRGINSVNVQNTHTITIANVSQSAEIFLEGISLWNTTRVWENDSLKLGILFAGEKADGFLSVREGVSIPKYYSFTDLEPGGATKLGLSDMKEMDETSITFTTSLDFALTIVFGFRNPGVFNNGFLLSIGFYNQPSTVPVYYPAEGFANYQTRAFGNKGTESFTYYKIDDHVTTDIKVINASVNALSLGSNHMVLSTTGQYDYSVVSAFDIDKPSTNVTNHFNWSVYLPHSSTVETILPTVPLDLLSSPEFPQASQLQFTRITFHESDGNSNLRDQYQFLFQSDQHEHEHSKEKMSRTMPF